MVGLGGCNCGGRCAKRQQQQSGYVYTPQSVRGRSVPPVMLAPNYRFLGAPPMRSGRVVRRLRGGMGDAGSAGVPAGTRLIYTCQKLATNSIFNRGSQIAAAIAPALSSKWGIAVDNEFDQIGLFQATISFSMQIHTTSDYGVATDVKSIIDGEIYNAMGALPISTIAAQNPVADAAASAASQVIPPPPPASDLGSWLTDNWMWFALGGVGLVAAKELL